MKLQEEFKLYENMWESASITEDWYGADSEVEFDTSVYGDIAKYFGLSEGDKVYYAYYFLDAVIVNYTDVKGRDRELEKHVPIDQVEEWFKAGYTILDESHKAKKLTTLKEANDEVKSLIKKAPSKKVTTNATSSVADLDHYDESEKVECEKCGAICVDSNWLDVPVGLHIWKTAFGWYCNKCHDEQSEYEWSIETFENACNDPDFFLSAWSDDGDEISDENIDVIAEIIDDWNKAKKDPNCMYSTLPDVVKQMELKFIDHAKNANLDINPSVFNKNTRENLEEARKSNPPAPEVIKIVKIETQLQKQYEHAGQYRHYDEITYIDPIFNVEMKAMVWQEQPGYGKYFGWGAKHSGHWNYAAYNYDGDLLPGVDPNSHISPRVKTELSNVVAKINNSDESYKAKKLQEARNVADIEKEIATLQAELAKAKEEEKRAASAGVKSVWIWDMYVDPADVGSWQSIDNEVVFETKDAAIDAGYTLLNELDDEGELTDVNDDPAYPDDFTVEAFEVPLDRIPKSILENSDLTHLWNPANEYKKIGSCSRCSGELLYDPAELSTGIKCPYCKTILRRRAK